MNQITIADFLKLADSCFYTNALTFSMNLYTYQRIMNIGGGIPNPSTIEFKYSYNGIQNIEDSGLNNNIVKLHLNEQDTNVIFNIL